MTYDELYSGWELWSSAELLGVWAPLAGWVVRPSLLSWGVWVPACGVGVGPACGVGVG